MVVIYVLVFVVMFRGVCRWCRISRISRVLRLSIRKNRYFGIVFYY